MTGSGKTFTMAKVVEQIQRPTLVLAHNKTLAAQLASEFREFLPDNAVEYFVSYYDYYQPEAYVARTDTYIEKDSSINDDLDRLRHAATQALFTRRDVLIVASVSCIYSLGEPEEYNQTHPQDQGRRDPQPRQAPPVAHRHLLRAERLRLQPRHVFASAATRSRSIRPTRRSPPESSSGATRSSGSSTSIR